MRSSEILKNEFLFFNDQKQIENKLKRDLDRSEAKKEKLEFFPFISGELLEQHRHDLSIQRHSDMKNYMVAKSQGMIGSIDRKYATPGRIGAAKESEISYDGQSIASSRLTKPSPSIVKALHDSCYIQPDQNPRVIQDSAPAKQQAWKDALARHENQVASQKHFNEGVLKQHYDRIQDDVNKNNYEED